MGRVRLGLRHPPRHFGKLSLSVPVDDDAHDDDDLEVCTLCILGILGIMHLFFLFYSLKTLNSTSLLLRNKGAYTVSVNENSTSLLWLRPIPAGLGNASRSRYMLL
jgi:hypothetical protein